MGWIYKITNQVNKKVYIGKTEHPNPNKRWEEHKGDRKRRKFEKRPFYYALNKYGPENFIFEVIDQCDDPDELCELEKYYIDKYRSYVGFEDSNGYNCSLGGDGRAYLQLNEEEVIANHIKNNYIAGRTAKMYNCDPESIEKILLKHNIKWLSNEEITRMKFKEEYGGLVQMDEFGETIIQIWECPIDVYKTCSWANAKSLSEAYRTHSRTHKYHGYFWYRLNELPEEYKPLLTEYYETHLSDDSLPIDENLSYIYV